MLSLVCVERQNKVAGIKLAKRQDYVLLAGYLLEQQLRAYIWEQYGKEVSNLRFSYGEQGKPYLTEYPKVHFNLSHSGDYVVVALGESELGVDVEVSSRNALAVAKRCFHEREYRELLCYEADPERLCQRFQQYWSMKEAYIKYTGKGLKTPLSSFAVVPDEGVILGQKQPVFYCKSLGNAHVSLCYEAETDNEVNYRIEQFELGNP